MRLLWFIIITFFPVLVEADDFGVILPLSGPLASYGTAARNGLTLSLEDGAPQNIKFEDSQGNAKDGLSAYKKLVNVDKVSAVYVWGSAESNAIAPIAETSKVPTFFVTSETGIAKIAPTYGIQFYNPGRLYAAAIAHYLSKQLLRNIFIIKNEVPYFNTLENSLRAELSPDQIISEVAIFSPQELDFSALIARLKQRHVDAIGVFLLPAQVSRFYQQLKLLQVSVPTIGTDVFADSTLISDARGAIRGVAYATDEVKESFSKRYLQRFGNTTQIAYAANAYEFAQLLKLIIDPQNANSSEQILLALDKVTSVEGNAISFVLKKSNQGRSLENPIKIQKID